jgi:hypothetical protein
LPEFRQLTSSVTVADTSAMPVTFECNDDMEDCEFLFRLVRM